MVLWVLAANNICVIKEKYCIDFRRKVTISIKDYYELNNLVRELNEKTAYGVSVVRVFEKSFIENYLESDNDKTTVLWEK